MLRDGVQIRGGDRLIDDEEVRPGRSRADQRHDPADELRAGAPAGLDYGTFRHADGSSFVHLAVIDTPDGSNPLVSLGSFKHFQEDLGERCVDGPSPEDLVAVDGYGRFALTSDRRA